MSIPVGIKILLCILYSPYASTVKLPAIGVETVLFCTSAHSASTMLGKDFWWELWSNIWRTWWKRWICSAYTSREREHLWVFFNRWNRILSMLY